MNNKVNYTVVGLLVLLGLAMILAFSYWLLKPTDDKKTSQYIVYFDESVLGLNIDAPVKYRGISVGKVTKLKINPNNSEQVEVLVTILRTTPVKVDTAAKLTAQGITGLSYINLSMGGNMSDSLKRLEGAEYPVIKSIPSFFENFEKSLGSVSTNLSNTLIQTEKLLNDENQEQVTLLLQRTAGFMDKLERLLDEKTIKSLQSSVQNLESTSSKIDKVVPNIDTFINKSVVWEENIHKSMDSIMVSYLGITLSMDEIRRAISSGEFNIKEITSDLVPTMNNTFLDMQDLMIKFQDTLNQYDRSPSDIFYKQEEIKKAPGEK
jgi:phospholipid/cholesterol/gamma-HCH transport system substrate-binding protein